MRKPNDITAFPENRKLISMFKERSRRENKSVGDPSGSHGTSGRPGSGAYAPDVGVKRDRSRRRRKIVVSSVAAITIAAATAFTVRHFFFPPACGSGLSSDPGECVGVTDGSTAFTPALASVEQRIAAENEHVLQAGKFVSVALLAPLTYSATSDATEARIKAELEAAYVAQHFLNQQSFRPQIRLLLANEGSEEQAAQQVAGQLQQKVSTDHLVAVVGVGLSTAPTLQAARMLATGPNPIPMIGTVDTADSLNNTTVPGLARVEPSVKDQVSLLHQYLANSGTSAVGPLGPAMLVYDTNPRDLYTAALGSDFRDNFTHRIGSGEPYDGNPRSVAVANEFKIIAGEVCAQGTGNSHAILYAGRESLFPQFIGRLRQISACGSANLITSVKFTVITGSDAESLPPSLTKPNIDGPQISVVYANLADSNLLSPEYTQAFTNTFGGDSADMKATWGIMTYDGVAAAEQAAVAAAGTSSSTLPAPSDVKSALFEFNEKSNSLTGATGPFLIQDTGDESCQQIPVIVDQGGKSVTTPLAARPHSCP